jgi:hypothetical protein
MAVAVGLGGLAVDEGWLPGRTRLRRLLGQTGPAGHIPDVRPGRVVSGSFVSRLRLGAETGWSVIYPGAHPELGIDRFLAAAVAAGVPRFAIATVDGGTTYWHPRPSGEDAGGMVLREFLPILERQGLRTGRIAFHGYSMGGYGALRLAAHVAHPVVRAVSVLSAAIWRPGSGYSSSGFSSTREYDRYTMFGRQRDLEGIPLRLDCGTEDPFYPDDQAYVAGFRRPVTSTFEDGAHDAAYWTRMMPAQLRFVGHALRRP